MNKSLLILIQVAVALIYATNAAPTSTTTTAAAAETPKSDTSVSNDNAEQTQTEIADTAQLVQPQIVTIAHLETLLKHAGEIFRPAIYQAMSEAAENGKETVEQPKEQTQAAPTFVAVPFEYMQPPNEQPYNFYFPMYDHGETQQLDAKSRKFSKIEPPPKPEKSKLAQPNYYAMKPKKVAKKFNAAQKQINLKWLNAYEKETGELPKATYLANDERHRINFDDSFFAVDMLVKAPATNEQPKIAESSQQDDYQVEEGEDLMAAAAAQVTQISVS